MTVRPSTARTTASRPGLARGLRSALVALTLLALSGCASVYLVDNQVQSFARWGDRPAAAPAPAAVPQAPQNYRFERLPSQREGRSAAAQDELENLARPALSRLGWSPAETASSAPWTVQVAADTLRLSRSPWNDPWYGPWGGFGLSGHRGHLVNVHGQIVWAPMFMHLDPPYYKREVSLVIRHAASGQVVYETHAAHEGPWNSTPGLWSAMIDAALRDFPTPPSGVRQVNIEVPR